MAIFAGLLMLLSAGKESRAADVTLTWDASPDTNVIGYNVYVGARSGVYTNKIEVGDKLSVTISNMASGATYYFAATAFTAEGVESEFSLEVAASIPAGSTNTAPTAISQTLEVLEDGTVSTRLNGSDPENNPLSFQVVSQPQFGTLTGTPPNVTYRPNPNYFGSDQFTFRVRDGALDSAAATVTIYVRPVNDPPTIAPVSDVEVNENDSVQTIVIAGIGSGAGNENDAMRISATSSAPNLISPLPIRYTSPAQSGLLSFSVAPSVWGSAVLNVRVDDGNGSNNTATTSFVVRVNSLPRISQIPDQAISSGATPRTLAFTLWDAETLASDLKLRVDSSNPGILPLSTLLLGGSGTNRTISISPANDVSGTSIVTLTASDGRGSSSSTFRVDVSANAPPSISSISDHVVIGGGSLLTFDFLVSDAEVRPEDLSVTATSSSTVLLNPSGLAVEGLGQQRRLKAWPSAGESGQAIVTLTVSDGRAQTQTSFKLTVLSTNGQVHLSRKGDGKLTSNRNGKIVTVKAAANPGSVFTGWTGTTISESPRLTLNLTNSQILTAHFEPVNIGSTDGGVLYPNLASRSNLVAGRTYSVKAIPADGFEFSGWTGATNTTSESISLVMLPNLSLTANFVPSPFIPVKGRYSGLFFEPGTIAQNSSGFFQALVTRRGFHTGKLLLDGKSYPFSGKFSLDGKASHVIKAQGTDLNLNLELGYGEKADTITGTIESGLWVATLGADRAVFNNSNPSPDAGRYTLVIPGQEMPLAVSAYGHADIAVSSNGTATISGMLADGIAFTSSANVSKLGQWPLYSPLYTKSGSILSWLSFENRSNDDVHGLFSWIKPPRPGFGYYEAGISMQSEAFGSRYLRPSASERVLKIADATLTFSDGDLVSAFNQAIHFESQNLVTSDSGNHFKMVINPLRGTFQGKVEDPTGQTNKFKGVFLQKQNAGYGIIFGTDQTGKVTLAP